MVTCVLAALFSVEGSAASLKAEDYFSGEHLAAYRLAQQGKTEQLTKAAKTVDLNLPGEFRGGNSGDTMKAPVKAGKGQEVQVLNAVMSSEQP